MHTMIYSKCADSSDRRYTTTSVHRLCSSWILVMLCASREEICGSPQSLLARMSSLAPTLCRASMDNCDVTEGISTKQTKRLRCSLRSMEQPQWDTRVQPSFLQNNRETCRQPRRTSQHSRDSRSGLVIVSPEVVVWLRLRSDTSELSCVESTIVRVAKTLVI